MSLHPIKIRAAIQSRMGGAFSQRIGMLVCAALGHVLSLVLLAPAVTAQEPGIATTPETLTPDAFIADTPIDSASAPYRRVFVRESDLSSLPLEGYRPWELAELPSLIEQLARRAESIERAEQSSEVDIRSLHLIGKLTGADLNSDRSRIQWRLPDSERPWRVNSAPRQVLSPWSLAIEGTPGKIFDAPAVPAGTAPSWLYNSLGLPWVRPAGEEDWFAWSLHPLTNSTPNRLNYTLAIPKTANSCLVLQLPSSARITDCTVVARPAENWQEVLRRLETWPVSASAPDRIPDLNTSDTYWLLELSGQEQASFTIHLGSSRSLVEAGSPPDRDSLPYTRLIAKQTVQHFVGLEQLRTLCEWDWFEAPTADSTVRIQLPDGVRLRSLTLNDREASFQFAQRTVVVSLPAADTSRIAAAATAVSTAVATSATRQRLSAEFLTDLTQLKIAEAPVSSASRTTARYALPAIEIQSSYVVSGSTALAPQSKVQLQEITSTSGRLVGTRPLTHGGTRLDFAWFQKPPIHRFQIQSKSLSHRAEILTKLATEGPIATAIVRMQLSPWQPEMPDRLVLAPGWQLIASQINSKAIELTVDETAEDSQRHLRLRPIALVDDTPIQLELQLTRNVQEDHGEPLDATPLVELPGWERTDALVMEPSYTLRLAYVGRYIDDLADEDDLTPWQRDRLPRLGKYIVFQMHGGRLPPIQWRSEAARLDGVIATEVDCHDGRWRFRHALSFAHDPLRTEPLEIRLPGDWRWEGLQPEGARPFSMVQNKSSGVWQTQWEALRSLARDAQGNVQLIATMANDSGEPSTAMEFPILLGSSNTARTLRLSSELHVIDQDPRARWEFDERGNRQLRWPSLPSESMLAPIKLESLRTSKDPSGRLIASQFHLVIDESGHQRGLLTAQWLGTPGESFDLGLVLPADWKAIAANMRAETHPSTAAPGIVRLRQDGNQTWLQILPATTIADSVETRMFNPSGSPSLWIEVQIDGPSLESTETWQYGLFPTRGMEFAWPEVHWQTDVLSRERFLWIPTHLELVAKQNSWESILDTGRDSSVRSLYPWWTLWDWTHSVLADLGVATISYGSEPFPSQGWSQPLAFEPPVALIPTWMARQYQRIAEPSPNFNDGTASNKLLLRSESRSWLQILAFTLWLILTPALLRARPWWCFVIAIASIIAGHWLVEDVGLGFRASVVGIGFGSALYLTYLTYSSVESRPKDRPSRSERWSPWNEPSLASEQPVSASSRSRGATTGLLILAVLSWASDWRPECWTAWASGQEPAVRTQLPLLPTSFDVIVPVDDAGKVAATTVYVPSEVLRMLEQDNTELTYTDRDATLIAARHSMRFDSRSLGFGNTEQSCIHTYDLWIGDTAVGRPFKIPFPSDRSRLNRFTVDGFEVASNRLTKNDIELIWYPDRTGRRVVQIESQLRVRPIERGPKPALPPATLLSDTKPPLGWSIDAGVLPAANAVMEVEIEGPWTVDIAGRGRVSNPSIGKYWIQIGGIDRITGDLVAVTNAAQRLFGSLPSDSPSLGGLESPQMSTELLVDREQLLARTILEYPRGTESATEVEIETDMQWLPVGTNWGDAQLIEVRPGSTLDRRRYIVRWNADPYWNDLGTAATGAATSTTPLPGLAPNKRTIITTWIPVGESNLRTILFAECRDRRVRQGTLRYARTAGSPWTLEGISTWSPLINTRERIEWNELSDKPIATSLKIPSSGGFGVLRLQSEVKIQRARVANQWRIEADRATLRSKIELLSAPSNSTGLLVQLPADYTATKATSRNRDIPLVQWTESNSTRIQIFLDKEANDWNEIVLTSERSLRTIETLGLTVPSLAFEALSIADQTTEIVAEPDWRVRMDFDSAPSYRGQGSSQVLYTLSSGPETEPVRLQLERMVEDWTGALIAHELERTEEGTQWELRFASGENRNAHPSFALTLPTELARQWTGEGQAKELTESDPGLRLLIVQPAWDEETQSHALRLRLTTDVGVRLDPSWVAQIQPIGEPNLECWMATEPARIDAMDSDLCEAMPPEQSSEKLLQLPLEGRALVRLRIRNTPIPDMGTLHRDASMSDAHAGALEGASEDSDTVSEGRQQLSFPIFSVHQWCGLREDGQNQGLIRSTYWIDDSHANERSSRRWEWALASGDRCEWLTINGESVPFRQQQNTLSTEGYGMKLPVQIDLWTTCRLDAKPVATWATVRAHRPIWMGDVMGGAFLIDSQEGIYSGDDAETRSLDSLSAARTLAGLTCLEGWLFDTSTRKVSESPEAWAGQRGRWMAYGAKETFASLLDWARRPVLRTDPRYWDAIERWQDLASRFPEQIKTAIAAASMPDTDAQLNTDWDAGSALFQLRPETESLESSPMRGWLLQHSDRLIATLILTLAVVLMSWFWSVFRSRLHRGPWWMLVCIGGLLWILVGSALPALVFLSIGWLLALDTYWIFNERFRQTGLRGLR